MFYSKAEADRVQQLDIKTKVGLLCASPKIGGGGQKIHITTQKPSRDILLTVRVLQVRKERQKTGRWFIKIFQTNSYKSNKQANTEVFSVLPVREVRWGGQLAGVGSQSAPQG